MPASVLARALDSISANKRLKRVGARTQPCFTPFVTGKGSDTTPSWITLAIIESWNERTIPMKLGGQPSLAKMDHRPDRLTVSKALVRSMNSMYRSWCCSTHFSCSCLTAEIISMVPLFFLNPHWLSKTTLSTKCSIILFKRTPARILPARGGRYPCDYHRQSTT